MNGIIRFSQFTRDWPHCYFTVPKVRDMFCTADISSQRAGRLFLRSSFSVANLKSENSAVDRACKRCHEDWPGRQTPIRAARIITGTSFGASTITAGHLLRSCQSNLERVD